MKKNTALLIMDMQTSIVERIENTSVLIQNVSDAIEKARKNNIPVIYIVVGFRQGMPEISQNNQSFYALKTQMRDLNMSDFMKIESKIAPRENDIIITKRRISAFTGSDLQVVLSGLGVQHLVLSGVASSGVVLSTVREAADKDFTLTVLENACADTDLSVHKILMTKIFPKQAEVASVQNWVV